MTKFTEFLGKYRFVILSILLVCGLTALIEIWSGRSLLGPDGMFGWWDGNILGSENSQRVTDVYSFSHIIHGFVFYALFAWISRIVKRRPSLAKYHRFCGIEYVFLASIALEAGWELLENSPIIINRYREATIAQGYVGDSVLNSVSDIFMVMIGFLIARFSKVWLTILLIIAFELGTLWWVRDNLILNVFMLVAPIESIKTWQAEFAPAQPKPVACTMEAKMCPDGSYVGRTGPNCEFEACPINPNDTTSKEVVSTMKIGENKNILDMSITAISIAEDSRCSSDVQCIQAGTVRADTVIGTKTNFGKLSMLTLSLGKPVDIDSYTVELVDVKPYPISTKRILNGDYYLTVKVTKK